VWRTPWSGLGWSRKKIQPKQAPTPSTQNKNSTAIIELQWQNSMIVSCTEKRIFEGEGPVAALVEGSPLQSSTRTQRKRIQSRRFHHLATKTQVRNHKHCFTLFLYDGCPIAINSLPPLLSSSLSTINDAMHNVGGNDERSKDRKIRCLAFCRREHKCCRVEDASEHPRENLLDAHVMTIWRWQLSYACMYGKGCFAA
jgi:hypothetical protein